MALDRIEIASLLKNRKASVECAERARSRAQTSVADGFDRLTAEFDALLARYGITPDA